VRIYLWFANEETINRLSKYTLTFVNNNTLLCGFCGGPITGLEPPWEVGAKEVCPHCGGDLIFPRAEW